MRRSLLIGCVLLLAIVGVAWARGLFRAAPPASPVTASATHRPPTIPPPLVSAPRPTPQPAAAPPVAHATNSPAPKAASRNLPGERIALADGRVRPIRRAGKRHHRRHAFAHSRRMQAAAPAEAAPVSPSTITAGASAAPVPQPQVEGEATAGQSAPAPALPAEPASPIAPPDPSVPVVPVETPAATAKMLTLSTGAGRLVRVPRPIAGVFVADARIADVQTQGGDAFYLLAKQAGTTTVYATDAAGGVLWSSDVRVGLNLAEVDGVLRAAMPEADVRATPIAGLLLLTGTVLGPRDADEAQRLAEQVTGGSVQILNRLKVATPQQVSLHVKIAEVSRSLSRSIGFNYRTGDSTGGFLFGLQQGRTGAVASDLASFTHSGVGTTLGLGGKLLGLDIRQVIDLAETDGLATTLAEPNLTALSGETASFLAGGEIPIPQSQGLGTVSVEFKQYGVSLAFTPTVMSNGRIALRVRPEVSQLTDVGSVKINEFTIPALITRRAETTVELGSGQSFAIGGLLQNSHSNSVDKAPILGDLPVIGALFRSNAFKKNETELVIVVTPYIVKPVDANAIMLPTDGYRSPTPAQRLVGGAEYQGTSGQARPMPTAEAPGATAVPAVRP